VSRPARASGSPARSARVLAAAQVRVAAGLVAAYDPAIARRAVRLFAGRPRVEESSVGRVPATIFRPGRGSGPWPAAIVFPGITRLGRNHPAFLGLGRGLAAVGHLVVVAEPDGLVAGELTPTAVLQARAATEAGTSRSDVAFGRVALVGVSGGATLALLAAADPALADRISSVFALAPCCDVAEAIRVVTTGVCRDGDALASFTTGDFFKLVIARSVVACLPESPDRMALLAHLRALDDYGADPLAALRAWPRRGLSDEARAVVELLANEDARRFDGLLTALPREVRAAVESLSPRLSAREIAATVELVVARADKYIPLADSTSFARACPRTKLTVIESLGHAVPLLSAREARDLARLDAVLVRMLAASYFGR
jgi:pimeloyl-ACP methyl ester carboxylesterase